MTTPKQKITLGEMRRSGMRGLLIYCSDHKCNHGTRISGDRWTDQVRLSDIEGQFVCKACGGADVRRISIGRSKDAGAHRVPSY